MLRLARLTAALTLLWVAPAPAAPVATPSAAHSVGPSAAPSASLAPALPTGFKSVSYDDLGFAAVFPSEPQRLDMDMPLGVGAKTGVDQGKMHVSTVTAQPGGGLVYMIERLDLGHAQIEPTALDTAFSAMTTKMTAQLGAKEMTLTGGPGHEMLVSRGQGLGRMRIWPAGKVLYVLVVMDKAGVEANVKSPDADRFLDGFSLKAKA